MTLRFVVLALAVSLAFPSAAPAKSELRGMQVCGSGGCAEVALPQLGGGHVELRLLGHPVESVFDPPPGPYYELRLETDAVTDTYRITTDASAILLERGYGSWVRTSEPLAARIRQASVGLEPFPATSLAARPDRSLWPGWHLAAGWALAAGALAAALFARQNRHRDRHSRLRHQEPVRLSGAAPPDPRR